MQNEKERQISLNRPRIVVGTAPPVAIGATDQTNRGGGAAPKHNQALDRIAVMNTAAIVFAYHERTKHHLYRYAAGPETPDWTSQPNPFREFVGSPRITLSLNAGALNATFALLYAPAGVVQPQRELLGAALQSVVR